MAIAKGRLEVMDFTMRRLLIAISLLVTCVQSRSIADDIMSMLEPEVEKKFTGEVWALLIAGSSGWGNYRHQADVYHAYQVLKRGGLEDDHIVVMHTNDLAGNFMNPFPGQIYNQPGGPDVYEGVPLDYTGEHVTSQNFLDVLLGNEGPKILGTSGKILKSGPKDRVFVYFADHGAPGILGMPSGDYLYADELIETLKKKEKNNGFADLVFYVEACESGSMFEGLLPKDLNIYVTTASNSYESSWGTYCPGMDPAPPAELTTCLGDLYSISFLENCDIKNLTRETLEKQYELVKLRTSNNGTYSQGSHVMQFGDMIIDEEPASDYLGKLNTGDFGNSALTEQYSAGGQQSVNQRDADLLHLWTEFQRAAPGEAKNNAMKALNVETAKRADVDASVRSAVKHFLDQPAFLTALKEKYAGSNLLLPDVGKNSERLTTSLVEQFVTAPLPRTPGLALVDDWDCLRGMMSAWQSKCGKLDQYGMQYSRLFANLCNAGISIDSLKMTAHAVCKTPTVLT